MKTIEFASRNHGSSICDTSVGSAAVERGRVVPFMSRQQRLFDEFRALASCPECVANIANWPAAILELVEDLAIDLKQPDAYVLARDLRRAQRR